MLAIEIDCVTHGTEEARERDLTRQARLESLGVSFLRFYDGEVKENLQGVLAEIESWVQGHTGTSLNLSLMVVGQNRG
jgi:very-short-patch-repair endonuclease